MQYIFVRHGEPADCYDEKGNYRPQKELGLSEVGKQQARQAGQIIKQFKPKYIFSSDTPRALETAQEINSQLGNRLEITITETLREHHIYENVIDSEFLRELDENRKEHLLNKAIPFKEAFEKCKIVMETLEKQQFNGNVVISTHGFVMEMFKFCALENEPNYEKYKAIAQGIKYDNNDIKNFCKMFAVDLDIPREQRKIIYLK